MLGSVETRTLPGQVYILLTRALAGPIGVWLVCAVLLAAGVAWYVSSERTIYYWDDAQYHDMTLSMAVQVRDVNFTSPRAIWRILNSIRESTWQDYSALHTLPIVPVVLGFGDSRLAYIMALALVYTLPYIVIVGEIAARLVPALPRAARWLGALLALTTPAIWLPSLRGYPDTGAAALIGLAVLLYLHDMRLGSRRQRWLIGLCLALAILVRRHFAYDTISFFVCVGSFTLALTIWGLRRNQGAFVRAGFAACLRLTEMVVATLIALAFFGWPFIRRVLSTNFGELYSSYQVSALTNLTYYQWYYGLLICAVAVAGLIVALVARSRLARPVVAFALAFGMVSLTQWVLSVQQLGVHYTLHFTVWIVLGLVAAAALAWERLRGTIRVTTLGVGGACLLLNFVVALGPTDLLAGVPLGSARALFTASYRPFQRTDYPEVVRLVNYLRTISDARDPIYVAASSGILNDDLLWQANRKLYENVLSRDHGDFWKSPELNILHWSPFADSRDPYPLEQLLYSRYVVIATPTQYHMQQSEQDVITVVGTLFAEQWEFSRDFTRLPERFHLADETTVEIYKRLRPTDPAVAVRTLDRMAAFIGARPGGQVAWMGLNPIPESYVSNKSTGYHLQFEADAAAPERSFLYLDLPAEPAILTGSLNTTDPRCGAVDLRATLFTADGSATEVLNLRFDPQGGAVSHTLPATNNRFLLLTLVVNPTDMEKASCWVTLDQLRITGQ